MSLIQTPWTSQPQQAVGIDWGNPITRGLVRFANAALGASGSFQDSANPSVYYTSAAPSPGVNSGGRSVSKNSTTIYLGSSNAGHSSIGTGDATFIHVGKNQSNNTSQYLCQIAGASSVSGDVYVGYRTGLVTALNVFGGTLSVSPTAAQVPGRLEVSVVVRKSGVVYFWLNGVYLGSAANASSFSSTSPFSLGGGNQKEVNAAGLFTRALSDTEILSLSQNPWQIFRPLPRRIFVPVATGGNVTITGNIGDATATGLTASVSQAASIAAGVGNSVAAGSQASIAQQYTLSAGIGDAAAAGLTATITASGLTTISCTTGNAAAAGSTATVNSAATVTCSVGNAAAAGLTAALDTAYTILANVGNATADGLSATIQAATGISCGVANAIAAGLTASITNNAPLTDSEKIDLILDILSNRQTLDATTGIYTLYADDGVTVLKTAQAWEDSEGTQPYRGRGLKRLDALQ